MKSVKKRLFKVLDEIKKIVDNKDLCIRIIDSSVKFYDDDDDAPFILSEFNYIHPIKSYHIEAIYKFINTLEQEYNVKISYTLTDYITHTYDDTPFYHGRLYIYDRGYLTYSAIKEICGNT